MGWNAPSRYGYASVMHMRIGDMERAWSLIEWVKSHRQKSGILSEQINPYTGEPHSVSPLVWSNAEFIIAHLKILTVFRNVYLLKLYCIIKSVTSKRTLYPHPAKV